MPYYITNNCIACGDCTVVCPRRAIIEADWTPAGNDDNPSLSGVASDRALRNTSGGPAPFYRITAACDPCNCCREICPAGAIIWRD